MSPHESIIAYLNELLLVSRYGFVQISDHLLQEPAKGKPRGAELFQFLSIHTENDVLVYELKRNVC